MVCMSRIMSYCIYKSCFREIIFVILFFSYYCIIAFPTFVFLHFLLLYLLQPLTCMLSRVPRPPGAQPISPTTSSRVFFREGHRQVPVPGKTWGSQRSGPRSRYSGSSGGGPSLGLGGGPSLVIVGGGSSLGLGGGLWDWPELFLNRALSSFVLSQQVCGSPWSLTNFSLPFMFPNYLHS